MREMADEALAEQKRYVASCLAGMTAQATLLTVNLTDSHRGDRHQPGCDDPAVGDVQLDRSVGGLGLQADPRGEFAWKS